MERSQITGVRLFKKVEAEAYWDKGDFEKEEEWQQFLKDLEDPEKIEQWYEDGEADCGNNALEDYKTYVEVQNDEGDQLETEVVNPDSEMYQLELTPRQMVMVLSFIHSSMNQELVEEYVEDENWDAGYEDELAQLQDKYPHELIEPIEEKIKNPQK